MCYKPLMRKWMREKLNRRKKSQEPASSGPAPLQPAYFEAEAAPDDTPQERPEGPSEEVVEGETAPVERVPAEDHIATASTENADSTTPTADNTRRTRRRRRGGRGRKRPSKQSTEPSAAQPTAPAASSPEVVEHASGTQEPAPPASAAPVVHGVVVLAVGLPGSGKSSWFKRHNITPLSSDLLRNLLFDDPAEQRFQDLVFSNLRSMLKARLIARRPMNYVDATNLTPHERHNWIKLARDFSYEVHAVFFDVPLDVCIQRHQRRDRIVPEDVMRKMSAKLRPPTFEEGFSKITVVRVKQKET